MKVLQIPYPPSPLPVAGGLLSIESLARCLDEKGIEGVRVMQPLRHDKDWAPLLYFSKGGDLLAARSFGQILDQEKPDLIHFHHFTPSVSLSCLREAKRRRIPAVFTYRDPAVSCQRKTLIRWGTEVCDGKLDLDLCTRCRLHGEGMPRPLASLVGRVPVRAGTWLAKVSSGRMGTALSTRAIVQKNHLELREFLDGVGHIVTLSKGIRDLLIRNGVPESKITISSGGVRTKPLVPPQARQDSDPAIRIVFLGRLHWTKGIQILIQALKKLKNFDFTLDIYGAADESVASWLQSLKEEVKGDSRFVFQGPVSNEKVIELLQSYDLLAVPSQWFDVWPRVVIEAFAAGIPVMGSRIGGIAEMVRDEMDGLLVDEPFSMKAWQETFLRFSEDPELLERLKAGVRPPRDIEDVTDEMISLYQRLCAQKAAVGQSVSMGLPPNL